MITSRYGSRRFFYYTSIYTGKKNQTWFDRHQDSNIASGSFSSFHLPKYSFILPSLQKTTPTKKLVYCFNAFVLAHIIIIGNHHSYDLFTFHSQ